MIALDTNVVSELVRSRPEPNVLDWVDAQPAEELALTAVTAAELLYGAARLPDGARKRQLGAAIASLLREDFEGRVLPFDLSAAEHYAAIVTGRERGGRPISVADGQIAGICRAHGAALATRNTADFEATGIRLIDPWTA